MKSSRIIRIAAACAAVFAWGCVSEGPTQPHAHIFDGAPQRVLTYDDGVRISEIHYDDAGADAGEAVEVFGPAGTDLTGWSIVLYSGSNGESYGSISLSGTIPDLCAGAGVISKAIAPIQNGEFDGMALVRADGSVVELLSYEGLFEAVGGPADGMISTDIRVEEGGSTPDGHSLQRQSLRRWSEAAPNTFGSCNPDDGIVEEDDEEDVRLEPDYSAGVFLSEIHYDNSGSDVGEGFEVTGPVGTDLSGWSVIHYNGNGGGISFTVDLSGVIGSNPGACPSSDAIQFLRAGLQNDHEGLALVDPAGTVVEFLSYEGILAARQGAASGLISTDIRVSQPGSTPIGRTLQRDRIGGAWYGPTDATWGCPGTGGDGDHGAGEPTAISVNASFVRLPAGFNRALFVTVVDAFRNRVEGATVTFTSSNAAVVTVDEFGNLKAEGIGAATVTVAVVGAPDVQRVIGVDVIADVASGVAYQDHLEFGEPTDADPSDDHLVVRDEMVLSYNATRGTSNWVSWNLDASHIGSTQRCDCYTPEPARPAGAYGVVNFDYTGSGYSRGHIAQSFNRTVTLPDNAATYYTSNIMPQSSANNGGPWGDFENYTVDRARAGAEVWLIAGGEFEANAPTLKDEGRVAIPSWTWKVAVFMDRDETLADVQSLADVEIIAIRTPNRLESGVAGSVAGISRDWESYVIEVDELETLIGYDLLDLLPETIEPLVESGFDDLMVAYAAVEASLESEVGNALSQQLEQARMQLEAGRPDNAVNRLETFLNQIRVFERNRKLDADTAAALRAEAQRVLAILNG